MINKIGKTKFGVTIASLALAASLSACGSGSTGARHSSSSTTTATASTGAASLTGHWIDDNATLKRLRIRGSQASFDVCFPGDPGKRGSGLWQTDVATGTLSPNGLLTWTSEHVPDWTTTAGTVDQTYLAGGKLVVIDNGSTIMLTKGDAHAPVECRGAHSTRATP